ncbi:MAG: UvrD-helicase domain-containing protein, partial [Firmicutes bacterium]|nr:UvrD-helicase domain-containing protein [Bacillota bacterium]
MFIADLHIHSRFSRATSRELTPEALAYWARRKGLGLIGTGDFTHPAWRAELSEKLAPTGDGLYALKEAPQLPSDVAEEGPEPRFVLSGEISSIYKKDGKVRKVHNVILLPSLTAAEALSKRLEAVGNLHSDGRPILGLDSRNLLEITLETCADALFIPAHIWTPHFSLFGAYSGFDEIEGCFGDLTGHIYALETGLSSDPPMNWRVSSLDRFALISNSDAHSPANLAREANVFDTERTYRHMAEALKNRHTNAFAGTIEFFPEEGKYHNDGHRQCKASLTPKETRAHDGLCPVCGRQVTVGVLHRVEALADREEGYVPPNAKRFESLVPLREVIASSMGVSAASARVVRKYDEMLRAIGDELFILRGVPLDEIERKAGALVAECVRRLRAGKVEIHPGYDGEYGKISLMSKREIELFVGQQSLFPGMAAPKKAAARHEQAKKAKAEAESARDIPSVPAEALPYGLNAEQWEAVSATEPVVAVIAGPGTGKTRTLVSRVQYLVEQCGVAPSHITAVTFTNKAAREMRERLMTRLADRRAASAMTIGTFHAICAKRLAREGDLAVAGEPDALHIVAEAMADLEVKGTARDALRAISLQKSGVEGAEHGVSQAVYDAYNARLASLGALDYDDILLKALALYEAEGAGESFSCLLVDEFQDINPVQYRLIRAWSGADGSLFVIGDPDQAIYGFRGSDARCFTRLFSEYPGARRIALTDNYRSTPEILCGARAALPGQAAPLRPMNPAGGPVLVMEAGDAFRQALYIAKEIGRLVGGIDMLDAHSHKAERRRVRGFADIAVLYRTNRQAGLLEECFAKEGIPYTVSGRDDFLMEPQARRAMAFFRLLLNPGDMLSLGVCLREGGQYGQRDIRRVTDAYGAVPKSLAGLMELLAGMRDGAAGKTLTGPSLRELIAAYGPRVAQDGPADLMDGWIRDNALSGVRCMELMRDTAVMYESMEELLTNLALGRESDLTRSGAKRYALDTVSLLTLHGAKGLEYPVVFLCGVDDGLIPLRGPRGGCDAEEEKRLLYVGMTRAREALTLVTSQTPSPFLAVLPADATRREKRKRGPAG